MASEISVWSKRYKLYGERILEENHCSEKNKHKLQTDPLWSSFLIMYLRDRGATYKSFNSYLKSAIPYVSMFLFVKFLLVNQDPDLFEIEHYNFMKNDLYFAKPRLHKLNIPLSQNNLKPIDDNALHQIKERFNEILKDKNYHFKSNKKMRKYPHLKRSK